MIYKTVCSYLRKSVFELLFPSSRLSQNITPPLVKSRLLVSSLHLFMVNLDLFVLLLEVSQVKQDFLLLGVCTIMNSRKAAVFSLRLHFSRLNKPITAQRRAM